MKRLKEIVEVLTQIVALKCPVQDGGPGSGRKGHMANKNLRAPNGQFGQNTRSSAPPFNPIKVTAEHPDIAAYKTLLNNHVAGKNKQSIEVLQAAHNKALEAMKKG